MFEFESWSAVADQQMQFVMFDVGLDRDRRSFTLRRDPMLDGIFDNRLQDHERDERVERLWRDVQLHAQAIIEANLLNGEIAVEKVELLGERHRLRMGLVNREPQQ